MKNMQSKHPAKFIGTCVYVHRKATDGRVFYIGIGSRNRAMAKSHRNAEWNKVASEHGCVVQVIDVYDKPEEAKQAEVEFIDLAKQLGAELTNRSPGGEGGKSPYTTPLDQAVDHAHELVKALGRNRSMVEPVPRRDSSKALDAIWAKRIASRTR
jgi:predicted GIY-YIG superfamily endonuclease